MSNVFMLNKFQRFIENLNRYDVIKFALFFLQKIGQMRRFPHVMLNFLDLRVQAGVFIR